MDHVRSSASRRRAMEGYAEVVRMAGPTVREQIYAIARDRWHARPSAAMEREEFWAAFERCLDAMPPMMRQATVFREVDGLPTDEVCRLLGITRANLWTLVHRGRLRLRAQLSTLLSERSEEPEQP